MRTMPQVWVIVLLPFVGLVIMSSLVLALMGLGNYNYDSSAQSQFMNTTCTVNDCIIQPFSQFKSGYTSNCAPTVMHCYEVMWEVTYGEEDYPNGIIFSSGAPFIDAETLAKQYEVNNTYPCFYLPSSDVVSWIDWSSTEKDVKRAVRVMIASFSTLIAFSVFLLCFAVIYVRTGRAEYHPIVRDSSYSTRYDRSYSLPS